MRLLSLLHLPFTQRPEILSAPDHRGLPRPGGPPPSQPHETGADSGTGSGLNVADHARVRRMNVIVGPGELTGVIARLLLVPALTMRLDCFTPFAEGTSRHSGGM